MKVTNSIIEKYAEMTDRNYHGELLVEAATDFNLPYFRKIFEGINLIMDTEGCIKADVKEVQYRFRLELRESLKHMLSDEDYQKITRYV